MKKREQLGNLSVTERRSYMAWHAMVLRCHDTRHASYAHYGARGITVCEEWRQSFARFFADMGKRPSGMSLDRINTFAGYSKDNCRWATPKEQASNTRRNKFVEIGGELVTVAEAARITGIPAPTIYSRLAQNRPPL